MKNLFQECFRMKQKLTQNQLSLYEDVTSLVSEAKNESLGMLKALRHQAISTSSNSRLNLLEEKVIDDWNLSKKFGPGILNAPNIAGGVQDWSQLHTILY